MGHLIILYRAVFNRFVRSPCLGCCRSIALQLGQQTSERERVVWSLRVPATLSRPILSSMYKGGTMPVRINVGVAKKVGQPNFGSAGATCNVEFELDGGFDNGSTERFQDAVRRA